MNIERFKGIEFVRISAMPKDQQQKIWESFERDKIIKIVKDQSLLNDCILTSDFDAWKARQQAAQPPAAARESAPFKTVLGKLALE